MEKVEWALLANAAGRDRGYVAGYDRYGAGFVGVFIRRFIARDRPDEVMFDLTGKRGTPLVLYAIFQHSAGRDWRGDLDDAG